MHLQLLYFLLFGFFCAQNYVNAAPLELIENEGLYTIKNEEQNVENSGDGGLGSESGPALEIGSGQEVTDETEAPTTTSELPLSTTIETSSVTTSNINETITASTPSPFSKPKKCGYTPVQPDESKIVGGYYAKPYSWPWQAQLCMISPFSGNCYFRCGGSLIDSEWLMSAAHCVDGYERYPELFRMKLGAYDYRNDFEDGELIVDIEKIHVHPSFGTPKMFSHDLSLLKIARGPINFTNHIQPVCLLRDCSNVIKEGNSAYVTGWGAVSEGGLVSNKLRQVVVPFLDMEQCKSAYSEEIDETMACAGKGGVDSCQGDSGGPLVARLEDRHWYQVGVVSWGRGCAQEGFAGVYSRPSTMCDFIEKTIGKKVCI